MIFRKKKKIDKCKEEFDRMLKDAHKFYREHGYPHNMIPWPPTQEIARRQQLLFLRNMIFATFLERD